MVRAYWAALDSERWDDARALTAAEARQQTDEGIAAGLRQAEEAGAEVDLRVKELSTKQLPADGDVRPVEARFLVELYGDFGFFSVKGAPDVDSNATFRVARVAEGVRIVRIDGSLLG